MIRKMEHGKIKFILLDKVGEAAIYQDVTPEEMLTVLERVWKIKKGNLHALEHFSDML